MSRVRYSYWVGDTVAHLTPGVCGATSDHEGARPRTVSRQAANRLGLTLCTDCREEYEGSREEARVRALAREGEMAARKARREAAV